MADEIHFDKNTINEYMGQYQNRVEELEDALISLEKVKVDSYITLKGDANKSLLELIDKVNAEQRDNILKERIIFDTLKAFLTDMDSSESSAAGNF